MGHFDGEPDDPFVMVGGPFDQRILDPPVARDKQRREDLQSWGCLQSLAARGALTHPVASRQGDDPPDRHWQGPEGEWGVELTQLTVEELRGDLARIRQLGRMLLSVLDSDGAAYEHLHGRMVQVTWLPEPGAVPTPGRVDLAAVVEALSSALREDRGYVGEGVEISAGSGFPAEMPPNGFYGRVLDEYLLQVNRVADESAAASVVATTNGTIRLSEARAGLQRVLAAKDDPRNEIVVITTGMVDQQGYVCPLDFWLFNLLIEKGVGELPAPTHLHAVLLHDYATGRVVSIYERTGAALPWPEGSARI